MPPPPELYIPMPADNAPTPKTCLLKLGYTPLFQKTPSPCAHPRPFALTRYSITAQAGAELRISSGVGLISSSGCQEDLPAFLKLSNSSDHRGIFMAIETGTFVAQAKNVSSFSRKNMQLQKVFALFTSARTNNTLMKQLDERAECLDCFFVCTC